MENVATENHESAAFKLAHLAARTLEGKELAEDLLDIGKRKAQRVMRKGFHTGEDYLDEATYYIKRNPWKSFAIGAGVGAFTGLIFGMLLQSRRS
ncbi:MAG TPA: hypothetical protein VHR36_11965 [Pyrinomonadaceae bacterium]|jgi:ElaB/YqjD/DUF883 family membrane-anchored ribosome-binding protein|nr:hypothetical protein [Pyrinomonadaceae bacterium]